MLKEKHYFHFESPIGWMEAAYSEESFLGIDFIESKPLNINPPPKVHAKVYKQLEEYFSGKRKNFDIEFKREGTEFTKSVWKEVEKIPYGKTKSYEEIALLLGDSKLSRAVGTANGSNPFPLFIPCHRVKGKSGNLTGYRGGLWRKKWLLEMEQGVHSPELF